MSVYVRGVLAGIAISGLATAMFEANKLALNMLWRFNSLVVETAGDMFQGLVNNQIERTLWRQQQQQIEVEDKEDET